MPYITDPRHLPREIQSAETAKQAIVRPTSRFAVETADNPDMVRTIEAQHQYVKDGIALRIRERLSKTADEVLNEEELQQTLSDEELAALEESLERQFKDYLTVAAIREHDALVKALKTHKIPLASLVEDKGRLENGDYGTFTDQIFATDNGQYFDKNGELTFIPSHFRNQQRKGEERLAVAQAEALGAKIHYLKSYSGEKMFFEGGDIRQMPGKKLFFVGQGHRSVEEATRAIADISEYHVLPIRLLLSQFYHLDCCFLPLPNDAAVLYEGEYVRNADGELELDDNDWPVILPGTETMDTASRALIRGVYPHEKLVLISKEEALAFATNAAVLENAEGRFKMFVNGKERHSFDDEAQALENHEISFTNESLEAIQRVTEGQVDVVEVPYSTMHRSGGSIRCSIQEVASTRAALTPHKNPALVQSQTFGREKTSRFFTQRAETVEDLLMQRQTEVRRQAFLQELALAPAAAEGADPDEGARL